jgi:hypothetical protein
VIRTAWITDPVDYDGSQLRSHWAYREHGIAGDSIVGFRGRCDVPTGDLVDLEDRRAGARIFGRRMVHFLVEHFDHDLDRAILRQRLLVCIVAETVYRMSGQLPLRKGDDLFVGEGKLTVSIATLSPVSTLIHLGVNEEAGGAPVQTSDLAGLGVDGEAFAMEVLDRYRDEMESAARARVKVQGVP